MQREIVNANRSQKWGRDVAWRAALTGLIACFTWGRSLAADAREMPVYELDGLAAVVGETVASADSRIILSSEVELLAQVALSGTGTELPEREAVPRRLLKAVLNEIVGECLIAREAERVRIARPSADEIARERQRLESAAGGTTQFRRLITRLSVSAGEIEGIVQRRALVTTFLRANLEGATVVPESEVEQAYRKLKNSLADHLPEEVKNVLRTRLARAAFDRSIARWVEVLRSRTPVHVLARY
jgi:hypothetical protein